MDLLSAQDRAMMDTLIQRAHDLACHLHDEAMACDDLAEKRALAADFHRVTRAFRQTLALKVRVLRDDAEARKVRAGEDAAARAAAAQAGKAQWTERTRRHRDRVETVLSRLIHERYDWDAEDAEPDLDRLSHILDIEEQAYDFEDVPADTLIARVAKRLDIVVTYADAPPEPPA